MTGPTVTGGQSRRLGDAGPSARQGSTGMRAASLTCAALLLWAALPVSQAVGGTVFAPSSGVLAEIPVLSMKEMRFRTVIRQQYDFSCGSAALATLLTFHYETPKTEPEVFFSMWNAGDKDRIQREGFSLADMQNYLKSVGLRSNGFKVKLKQLADANIPAITLINTNGYRHFVVIKGITKTSVLVGDPVLGIKKYSVEDFKKIWIPIAFVVEDRVDTARTHYSSKKDWSTVIKAPIGSAMSPADLGSFTIGLPAMNQF